MLNDFAGALSAYPPENVGYQNEKGSVAGTHNHAPGEQGGGPHEHETFLAGHLVDHGDALKAHHKAIGHLYDQQLTHADRLDALEHKSS